jgi:hypothetical protein|tara:strand:- start:2419 stop:2622 length:204 start_codon:yes stop_codon:yes gene_type:complete
MIASDMMISNMRITEPEVMQSAAGYYVGEYYEEEDGMFGPYSRLSEYFATAKQAEAYLRGMNDGTNS